MTRATLICDIETYSGFFLVAFKRVSDGKIRTFEHSDRCRINGDQLLAILLQNRIVTFNGLSYDIPLIFYALKCIQEDPTTANQRLKQASDQIINGRVRYWEVEQLLDIVIPRRLDHIDLIEPQPNAFASLKTLNGRMHGKRMQDLPIEPDARLTHADMDALTSYCVNDLDATELLWNNLAEPMALREALSEEYGINFRSKSDSQIGEAIVKKRVEQATGEKVQKVPTPAGTSFRYKVPPYMRFETPELQAILDRLRETDFIVQHNGKVDLPEWLTSGAIIQPKIVDGVIVHPERKIGGQITINQTTYQMGIGGLHSTESQRSVHSDDSQLLVDCDVTGYYPNIIINSGLYPKSLGPQFLPEYTKIRDERSKAKRRMQEIDRDIAALEAQLAELEEA